ISQSRLLNLGDTVMLDGHYGTVEDITLTHTVVKIWDWRRHVIPNSAMLNMHFVNYSLYDSYVWVHVEFTISQDSDLEKVKQLALASPSSSVYLAKHEDPRFWIRDVSGPCIRCWVAAWADSPADAWMLAHDMRTNIVESFQREGIRTEVVLHRLVENPKNHPVLQDSPESTTARVNAASDYVATNPTSQQPWQSPMDPAADHRWQSSVDTVAAAEAAAQG
ncbi:MAG: mechanosensitive ion channel domain-containing protein, partial [Myxococcota bacterium]